MFLFLDPCFPTAFFFFLAHGFVSCSPKTLPDPLPLLPKQSPRSSLSRVSHRSEATRHDTHRQGKHSGGGTREPRRCAHTLDTRTSHPSVSFALFHFFIYFNTSRHPNLQLRKKTTMPTKRDRRLLYIYIYKYLGSSHTLPLFFFPLRPPFQQESCGRCCGRCGQVGGIG